MPRRKEDTPSRIVKRTYEEKHRDERKQKSMLFGTSIDREYGEEIKCVPAKVRYYKSGTDSRRVQSLAKSVWS